MSEISPGCAGSPELDDLLDRFEEAWQGDSPPRLEQFVMAELGRLDAVRRRQALIELVRIDMDNRWRRANVASLSSVLKTDEPPKDGIARPDALPERPYLSDYLEQFPVLGPLEQLPPELIGEEYWVRQCWGDRPGQQEYLTRFSSQAAALGEVLSRLDAQQSPAVPVASLIGPATAAAPPVAIPLWPAGTPLDSIAVAIENLRVHDLVTPTQLTDLVEQNSRSQFPDVAALGRYLVERNWLTSYQVEQLVQGNAASLVLGHYLLLERVGEGITGQVYRGRHRKMNRLAAIKVIRPELLANAEAVRRFYKEIQAASQLSHPNIVQAYDAGPIGHTHFLAMEFVEGTDLGRLVKRDGPLPLPQACDCIRQAAAGLQHLAEHGLVHRDIKPSNLLVGGRVVPNPSAEPLTTHHSPLTTVKIVDLGLAGGQKSPDEHSTLTHEGTVMGTPDFMAPEQAKSAHQADVRADLYSLGCTFYYLLTGQVPFPGGTFIEKVDKHRWEEPPPVEQLRADVPPALAAIVRKLMAKRPEDRYQAPAELMADLSPMAAEQSPQGQAELAGAAALAIPLVSATSATQDGPVEFAEKRRSRRHPRMLLVVGLLGLLGLGGVAAFTGWPSLWNRPQTTGRARMSDPALSSGPTRAELLEVQLEDYLAREKDTSSDRQQLRAEVAAFRQLHFGTSQADRAAALLAKLMPGATEIFVAANGKPSNPGTRTAPVDLSTVLLAKRSLKPGDKNSLRPGDIVWLLPGTYRAPPDANNTFLAALQGAPDRPITLRALPGKRVTLASRLDVRGGHLVFWDLEITDPDYTTRTEAGVGANPVLVNAYGPKVKFINLHVHDGPMAFGLWTAATDAEVYGCILHDCGYLGSDRVAGGGMHMQNAQGTKRIVDNILFHSMAWNIYAYTQKGHIDGLHFEGNFSFGAGTRKPGHPMANILIAGVPPADRITLLDNCTYHSSAAESAVAVQLESYGPDSNGSCLVKGNVFMGGHGVQIGRWNKAEVTGNTMWGPRVCASVTPPDGRLANYRWDNNTYVLTNQATPWLIAGKSAGAKLADWQKLGFDAQAKCLDGKDGRPRGTQVFVRPNRYEPGRAHVAVYNWDRQPSVEIDLSRVLKKGARFAIFNAQDDLYGKPAATGVYDGKPVRVPTRSSATAPDFEAFLVRPVAE
jgi:serine/threonine-protein kinase